MDMRRVVWIGLVAGVVPLKALAQEPYPLHEMNFDMWCQEEKHLPPDRCDQRLPQDDAEFEAYRATIEKYEIPYLQQRQQEQNLNQLIVHNDPVDHPIQPSTPQNVGGAPPCSGPVTCSVMPPPSQTSGATAPAGGTSPQ
jgi:hypothetical protein